MSRSIVQRRNLEAETVKGRLGFHPSVCETACSVISCKPKLTPRTSSQLLALSLKTNSVRHFPRGPPEAPSHRISLIQNQKIPCLLAPKQNKRPVSFCFSHFYALNKNHLTYFCIQNPQTQSTWYLRSCSSLLVSSLSLPTMFSFKAEPWSQYEALPLPQSFPVPAAEWITWAF